MDVVLDDDALAVVGTTADLRDLLSAGLTTVRDPGSTVGIESALRNGVATIEHGIYVDEVCIELFHGTRQELVPHDENSLEAEQFVEAVGMSELDAL